MNSKLIFAIIVLSIFLSIVFERSFVDYASTAKAYRARSDSRAIKSGIEEYIDKYGSFNETNSLNDLVDKNIIKKITNTPWGNNYYFLVSGKNIIVYTPGKDGINNKNSNDDRHYDVESFDCETHEVGCLKERIIPTIILGVVFSLFLLPIAYIGYRITKR